MQDSDHHGILCSKIQLDKAPAHPEIFCQESVAALDSFADTAEYRRWADVKTTYWREMTGNGMRSPPMPTSCPVTIHLGISILLERVSQESMRLARLNTKYTSDPSFNREAFFPLANSSKHTHAAPSNLLMLDPDTGYPLSRCV